MKNFIKKYWTLLIWLLSFGLDQKYQILEHFIKDAFWLEIAKGIGALILAYLTKEKLQSFSRIGGSNPPIKKDEK